MSFVASAGWSQPFIRIGHSGAGGLAPPNTLKSLSLALELGVDAVEFDVRPCLDCLVLLHDDDLDHFTADQGQDQDPGRPRLASQASVEYLHSLDAGQGERIPTLEEVVDLLKGRVLMNVDLKAEGCEATLLEMLRRKGVMQDVLISSLTPGSLRRIKELEPEVKTGLSYPEDRHDLSSRPVLDPLIQILLRLTRAALPYRIRGMMDRAGVDAVMLNTEVLSPAVVERVRATGRRVFVWTVDDPQTMRRLHALGVDGITSNRPDLFGEALEK